MSITTNERARLERLRILEALSDRKWHERGDLNELAGFAREHNTTQRLRILIDHGHIETQKNGKRYGKVEGLEYQITDAGMAHLVDTKDRQEKPTSPNFDLFSEQNSPIAHLIQEIREMQCDLEKIKAIAGKYMDQE